MVNHGSYKINDFSLNTRNEMGRLEAQIELFWEKELHFYRLFGLADDMAIVECGCGTGLIGRKLLQAFPGARITAFDIDPLLVETAKKNAQQWNLHQYEVLERPIGQTRLPADQYDFAITRLILEHLTNPADAVKEVFRILKPGGKAIFVDNDFEFHLRTYPDLPELKALYEGYCRAREDEGGNPKIGRQLPNLLKRCGFSNVDMQIVNAHSAIVGDGIFLQSEGSAIPAKLVKDGYLSGEVYTDIAKKWRALLQTEDHGIFRQLFICVGEKIPEAAAPPSPPAHGDPVAKRGEKAIGLKPPSKFGDPEEIIGDIWCRVLGREHIGKNENFFEAGGSSSYALDIVERLETELGKHFSVVALFENPTIALFAKFVSRQNSRKEHLSSAERKEMRTKKILGRRQMIKNMREGVTDGLRC